MTPDAVLHRPRDHARPRSACEQGERRLNRVDVAHRLAPRQQGLVEVARADPADLPLVHQLGHGTPGVLHQRAGHPIGPVSLKEVDALDAEPAQARLALLADRLRPEVVLDDAFRAALPTTSALREDVDVLAGPIRLESSSHDVLGVPEPVDGSGIHPVDTEVHRVPDGRNGVVVVDVAPAEAPRAADRPRSEADGRKLQARSHRGGACSRACAPRVVEVVAPRALGRPPEHPLGLLGRDGGRVLARDLSETRFSPRRSGA